MKQIRKQMRSGREPRRSIFPDEKGIETTHHFTVNDKIALCRSIFPDEKGIETEGPLSLFPAGGGRSIFPDEKGIETRSNHG